MSGPSRPATVALICLIALVGCCALAPARVAGPGSIAAFIDHLSTSDSAFEVFVGQGRILTTKGELAVQGKPPPPFDILYWNADTTRLPAALHRDFIRLALDNAPTKPGAATMLGTPVDLSKVDADTYVVAGLADHLCPWQSCYRSTQLLGGDATFVLSTSGHIASMVNPPTNPKSSFQTASAEDGNPADPRAWLAAAETSAGSWWPHYSAWLAARSGPDRKSRVRPGRKGFPVLAEAPGTYVRER